MIQTQLKDKVVLVTGANHGIGAATAKAFAAEDAAVFISFLGSPPADEVVNYISKHGRRAIAVETDLANPATIPVLFDRAEDAFGPVDVLVNNAAYWEPDTILPVTPGSVDRLSRPVGTVTTNSIDRHFAVNTRAVVLMMAEYVSRHVKRDGRWGRIINVSSDGAYCFPGEISYGASKAALEAFTRSVAIEIGPLGVTVNAVSPGPVHTGTPSYITLQMEETLLATIPLRRIGQPEDIADVIVFLATEQARWITGQVIKVGGGHSV